MKCPNCGSGEVYALNPLLGDFSEMVCIRCLRRFKPQAQIDLRGGGCCEC